MYRFCQGKVVLFRGCLRWEWRVLNNFFCSRVRSITAYRSNYVSFCIFTFTADITSYTNLAEPTRLDLVFTTSLNIAIITRSSWIVTTVVIVMTLCYCTIRCTYNITTITIIVFSRPTSPESGGKRTAAVMNKGYENAACDRNGCEVGARPTAVEMERVAVKGAAATPAECCGGGVSRPIGRAPSGGRPSRTFPGPGVPSDVCLPKCPAVSSSPWDPIKTWLAIALSAAMLVWAGLGVYFIKFRKAQ